MIIQKESPLKVLKKVFGYNTFRGEQEAVIQSVLNGDNTFVIMPTGGGKSLCYQLPALMKDGTAIVISPLIALMKNQVDALRGVSTSNSIAHYLNSSLSKEEINGVKSDVKSGLTKVLYLAPESLQKMSTISFLKAIKISFLAIDEAHCISEWGHDFRPEYRKIKNTIKEISNQLPIIALTATATPKVQSDIIKNLGVESANKFKESFNRSNLFYSIRPKNDVLKDIVQYVKSKPGKSGVIYCMSRKKVEEVAKTLTLNGIKALPYHAGLDISLRSSHQDKFLKEDVDVIVATIAFGMGIDKPDVRYVIHHDVPKSIESYYQETGRAGRDGKEGECITYYSYEDIERLERFNANKNGSEKSLGRELLRDMSNYVESSECRRRFVLHYFGEQFDSIGCNKMCDNCKDPKESSDAKNNLKLLLELMQTLNAGFKKSYLISLLVGIYSNTAKKHGHNVSKYFGLGKNESEHYWSSLINKALLENLITKSVEDYGLLLLNDLSFEFLKTPFEFTVSLNHNYEESDNEENALKNTSDLLYDQKLYHILKALNKQVADEQDLPPYVIFSEVSLQDMCVQYPITSQELKCINGVGHGKASKFGKRFINAIKQYVEENNIERLGDVVVKTLANKSMNKIFIIQSVDRKMPLEDIASAKGWKYEEVLQHIEHIVNSGTKVNLNYYIDEMFDHYQQEEVFDCMRSLDRDCIETVQAELGEDEYTKEDLRLMRVKFLSDHGN